MTVFLLVHGGSHGSWCWDACAEALRREGHQALSFDLPGHGQDPTPRDQVNLKAYAEAIRDQLEQCGPEPPVLVGHSLAGIGIAEAMATASCTVDQLVMVAALVLKPGERAIDRIPESRRPSYFELAEASADQTIALSADVTRKAFFNDLDETQAAAYHARLTPQPLGVYLEESRFDLSTLACPKHYLACKHDQALGLDSNLLYAERLGGTTRILEAGHDVMLSEPEVLAQALMAHLSSR